MKTLALLLAFCGGVLGHHRQAWRRRQRSRRDAAAPTVDCRERFTQEACVSAGEFQG